MAEVLPARRGREGSRWVNERPSPEDVAAWFKTMPLHDGMDHEKYVAGLTLIPAKDKGDEIVGYQEDGSPVLAERVNQTFTPYMKVETRVAYFWDLIRQHKDEGWVGRVEPVVDPLLEVLRDVLAKGDIARLIDMPIIPVLERIPSLGLPPGYFKFSAAKPDGKTAAFVGYSVKVTIHGFLGEEDKRVVIAEGTGTKIVPAATRWDADINSLMKAETGAIGRALGFAGILVLPGSGVATAEDMQEALANTGTGGITPEQAALPAETTAAPGDVAGKEPAEDADVALRRRAKEIIDQLTEDHPDDLEKFQEWARGRGFRSLNELTSPALKGVIRKLEKTLGDAQAAAPATPEPAEDIALGGGEKA